MEKKSFFYTTHSTLLHVMLHFFAFQHQDITPRPSPSPASTTSCSTSLTPLIERKPTEPSLLSATQSCKLGVWESPDRGHQRIKNTKSQQRARRLGDQRCNRLVAAKIASLLAVPHLRYFLLLQYSETSALQLEKQNNPIRVTRSPSGIFKRG